MLALRLSIEMEKQLADLAEKTGRTKSYYAKLAISEFLTERADYLIALDRLQNALPSIPLDEVEKLLGLSD